MTNNIQDRRKEAIIREIFENKESLTQRVADFYDLRWINNPRRINSIYGFKPNSEDIHKYGEHPKEIVKGLELLGSNKFDVDKLEYQKVRQDISRWQKLSRRIAKIAFTFGGLALTFIGPFLYSKFSGQPIEAIRYELFLSTLPGFCIFTRGLWYTVLDLPPRNSDHSSDELLKLSFEAGKIDSLSIGELREKYYLNDFKW